MPITKHVSSFFSSGGQYCPRKSIKTRAFLPLLMAEKTSEPHSDKYFGKAVYWSPKSVLCHKGWWGFMTFMLLFSYRPQRTSEVQDLDRVTLFPLLSHAGTPMQTASSIRLGHQWPLLSTHCEGICEIKPNIWLPPILKCSLHRIGHHPWITTCSLFCTDCKNKRVNHFLMIATERKATLLLKATASPAYWHQVQQCQTPCWLDTYSL